MRNAKVLAGFYVGVLAVSVVAVKLVERGPVALPDVELASALTAFEECDEALAYFTEAASRPAGTAGIGDQMMLDEATAEAAPADSDGGARAAFSETNVQEAGVDEPDLVKTDGRRIVTVSGGLLHVLDATGELPSLAGSLALPAEWGHELLLDGDRALVFSSSWSDQPARGLPSRPGGSAQSVLTLVDVAETATPRVASTLTLEGEYVSARMVGGVARVVLRSWPAGPVPEPQPMPAPLPDGDVRAAPSGGAGASGDPREAPSTAQSAIDDWVPHYSLESDEGTTSDRLVPCDRIHRPAELAGVGMVSVVSVDLAGDLTPGAAASVVADAQTVYASPDHLYVAFTTWGSSESTEIHAFDITDPAAAVYTASGSVPGRLLNQWALSEHAGHLRVATTEGDPWGGDVIDFVDDVEAPDGRAVAPVPAPNPSHSAVTVLAPRGEELVQVGRVEGLGPEERIYSVRFMGDVGYVVTFRETDPLYTLDLADPANPRVLGELKILGYSAYLHPLGDGLLLGVGQDATEDGQRLGTQLSVFDVGDLTNPTRIHQATLPGGNSTVEYDHRAFLHWAPTGTIVLPVEIYPPDGAVEAEDVFTGAVAFTVDGAAGIIEAGRVSHADHVTEAWAGSIRRALVVGETLYTVSEEGVLASDLVGFGERAWISLR